MDITEKVLIVETTDWKIQLFRYVIVGGFSFLIDYGLLYFLTEYANFYYILSASISFIVGLIVNYILSTKWIFRKSRLKNTVLEFIIYGIIGILGLILNNILLYIFTDFFQIYYMISKLITAVLVMGWNFVGRRIILFNNYN
jgi:putative flippase GtrA